MWHMGFCTWGIQTVPFAACWADFVQIIFRLFDFHTGESNYLLPQREGLEMRKGIPPTVSETQGFQYLGHSNWTICSLWSWFCTVNFPSFWLSYWGVQLSITPEKGKGLMTNDASSRRFRNVLYMLTEPLIAKPNLSYPRTSDRIAFTFHKLL